MNRHKFNIFPEAKPEDYARLIDDIQDNGYDQDQPVILYQGAILDGWNRNKACVELMIKPPTKQFIGSDLEAIQFVMRTNKRRNMNSGQWATVAVEAVDIMEALKEQVEKEKANKVSQSRRGEVRQIIAEPADSQKTATKAAELFQTNRTYINQATNSRWRQPDRAPGVDAKNFRALAEKQTVQIIEPQSMVQIIEPQSMSQLFDSQTPKDNSKLADSKPPTSTRPTAPLQAQTCLIFPYGFPTL